MTLYSDGEFQYERYSVTSSSKFFDMTVPWRRRWWHCDWGLSLQGPIQYRKFEKYHHYSQICTYFKKMLFLRINSSFGLWSASLIDGCLPLKAWPLASYPTWNFMMFTSDTKQAPHSFSPAPPRTHLHAPFLYIRMHSSSSAHFPLPAQQLLTHFIDTIDGVLTLTHNYLQVLGQWMSDTPKETVQGQVPDLFDYKAVTIIRQGYNLESKKKAAMSFECKAWYDFETYRFCEKARLIFE